MDAETSSTQPSVNSASDLQRMTPAVVKLPPSSGTGTTKSASSPAMTDRRDRYQRGGTRATTARTRESSSARDAAVNERTTAEATTAANRSDSRQRASSEASGEATTGGGVKRICTSGSSAGWGDFTRRRRVVHVER